MEASEFIYQKIRGRERGGGLKKNNFPLGIFETLEGGLNFSKMSKF